jgi:tetratricopeptide (TPR) repeat protein
MEGSRVLDSACRPRGDGALKRIANFESGSAIARPSPDRQAEPSTQPLYFPTVIAADDVYRTRFPAVTRALIFVAFALCGPSVVAQAPVLPVPESQEVKRLAAGERWQEIVDRLGPVSARSADMDFYYGTALAHLERWPEAETAFEEGRRLAPSDPRFPTELAGIAFRQKRYSRAAGLLRESLRLKPGDEYTNDFLGSIYFLQGNLPAALKYWNRIGKPTIEEFRQDPEPRTSPTLLDRAFAFSPAGVLTLRQLLDSEERVRGLGIFPQYQFDLRAEHDGKFAIVFRNRELNGFGDTRLEALARFFRELPFQGVAPEYDNFRRADMNFTSLIRWDAQKRRIFAEFSSPFEHSAKYRYDLFTDLRNENWVLRDSFTGPAPALAGLNLRSEVVAFDLTSHASDRWRWSAGAEGSHRDFRNVEAGTALTPALLATGFELQQGLRLASTLWRVPEHRFTVIAEAASQASRLWSQPGETSERLTGSLAWHWFPRAEGDDYEMQQRLRAGKTLGQVPFDELFMLGLERDNDLPMRAHIGTRDGRKGSAPLGRDYLLHSIDVDKNLYGNGLMTVKLGPFLDIGKIADSGTSLGSHQWLFDTGAEAKLRVFGSTVAFSYGRDLRTGNNAVYVTLMQ